MEITTSNLKMNQQSNRLNLKQSLASSAFAILLTVVSMATFQTSYGANVKVILLGGQSNAVGQAASTGLPTVPLNLQLAQSDVLFYYDDQNAPSTLTTLQPGSGGDVWASGLNFGPEVSFGRAIADAKPSETYAIIKHGENGTALYNSWNPTTGASYAGFQSTVTDGLAALQAAGHTTEIVGMLWMQGESDALQGQASNYQANLNAFIADVRTRYGANLPFVIGEITRSFTLQGTDYTPAFTMVADTQIAVGAADPFAKFVPAADLTFPDGIHFGAASTVTLGERFAAAFLELTSNATIIYSEDHEDSPAGAIAVGTSSFSIGWTGAADFTVTSGLTLDAVVQNGTYTNANNNLPAASHVGGQFTGTLGRSGTAYANTGQTFTEGTEYEFSFLHYQSKNSPTGGRGMTLEIYDVNTNAVYASQVFAAVNSFDAALTRSLSYTATSTADGNNIGVRFIADSTDHNDSSTPADENNFYSTAVDNILLTAAVPILVTPVMVNSTTEMAYATEVSASDLLHGLTPIESGFITSATAMNDGVHGLSFAAAGNTIQGTYTATGATAEFNLGSGANGSGYDISSIHSIASWNGAAFGNQMWKVEVKTLGGSWAILDTVDYQPLATLGATKVVLADPSGVLASNIEAIRFTANGAFVWREMDVFGQPSALAPDANPPLITTLSPDDAEDISVRTKLVATFDENIALGTGDITIVNLDTSAETVISLPDARVTVNGALLIIEPSSFLLENTNYAVRVAATVVDDLSGNSFAGILDNATWTFKTYFRPLRIMCIGDSITVGYTDNPNWTEPFKFGYRSALYNLMKNAGYSFQFVGDSVQPWDLFSGDPSQGGTYKPAFDMRDIGQDYQQGGGGAPITAIPGWLTANNPDLILLMIGINGISTTSPAQIEGVVNTIVTQNPDAHVIIAQITPYAPIVGGAQDTTAKNQLVYDYNIYIRDTLVPNLVAAGHKVKTADMYSLFLTNPNLYTSPIAPGMHSNNFNHPFNAEYDLMAQRWFDVIETLNLGDDGFRTWINDQTYGIDSTNFGFGDDPDNDNLSNGVEAWLGTDPSKFNAGIIVSNSVGNVTTFQHSKNPNPPSDLVAKYEWSPNLTDWYDADGNDGPPAGQTVVISPNTVATTTTGTATSSAVLPKLFIRLNVVQN